jgi:acyl-CoA synthetase (AMP-forming)/AMP-acid ligase II
MMEEPTSATDRSFNIASWLEQRVAERPFQKAVIFPQGRDANGHAAWTHLTFRELNNLCDEYARGFEATGVARGDRVSLLVKPCLEFIPLVFALFKIGAVPVLIDPGMGRKPFLSCIERMAPRVLLAEAAVHVIKPLVGKALKSVEISITVGKSTGWWADATLEGLRVPSSEPYLATRTGRDEEAAILFTSGSTGPAKGVTYTHGTFDAQTRAIGALYDLKPGEVDLACFPLFGLFSMALGLTVVIPDMDPTKPALADPAKLVEAIQSQGCTFGSGSPAIWKRVGPYCEEHGIRLDSMQRILMFGAPIPVWMHQNFRKVLPPGAQIHTPYGSTESLPVASIGTDEVLDDTRFQTAKGAGICVGRPAPDMEVCIIAITENAVPVWSPELCLPDGEIGEIVVKGDVVTLEYKSSPEHTALAKIQDGDRIRHRMGDLGWIDEQGRVWMCGRKSHRVRLANGQTLFTTCCEAIFNEHPQVYRSALVGVAGEPVIVVEREPEQGQDTDALTHELLKLGAANPLTAMIQRVLFHDAFPVDVRHNAKIHRPELAAWAAHS